MSKLRLLLLEDNDLDAELVLANLAEGGFDCEAVRVQTRAEYLAALKDGRRDLILADYSLPAFDGVSALKLARELCPSIPFLFVSGAMGEEVAIEMLKSGATDYVLKHRLERLVPSVRRALREAAQQAEQQRLEEELRRRAEELAEINRRKDEFLAMLGHELRNPLAPLRNVVQLLRLRGGDPALLPQVRGIIERQVGQLARLVDDLLDVSRINQGKVELRKERVDLSTVVGRAVEASRPLLDERRHHLTVLPAAPLAVEADPARLEQVVTNLLTNAAKYTPPGGRIDVTAAAENGDAVVRVRDNGIGIRAEDLPFLFDAFHQADHVPGDTREGLGLGLALVRRLVELHGGRVAAQSPGPGQGSEFLVRLPLAKGEPAPAAEEKPVPAPAAGGRPRSVLVVDDNRDAACSLALLLELAGHRVRVVHDGPAALEAAAASPPEAVLLDIGLPGMSGYDVARKLREQPGTRAALLVAMTGYGQEGDRRRSREAGFDAHLVKPIDSDEVCEILARPRA